MSTVAPGWYKDPADPTTQRYWDGEGWLGEAIPADAKPPAGPPPKPIVAAAGQSAQPSIATHPGATQPATQPGATLPGAGAPPGGVAGPPRSAYNPPGRAQALPAAPSPHGYPLAGVGARFVARLIDVLAVLGLCAVANSWFAYQWWQAFEPFLRQVSDAQLNGGAMPEAPAAVSNLFLMMCVVATAVWFAYEVPGSANSGQTMGKRLMRIKVIRLDSADRLGFGRAFRRWGRLGLPTLLWPCFGIGALLQVVDCMFVPIDRPLHQALHDKVALTVVVQVGRSGSDSDPRRSDASRGGRHADKS